MLREISRWLRRVSKFFFQCVHLALPWDTFAWDVPRSWHPSLLSLMVSILFACVFVPLFASKPLFADDIIAVDTQPLLFSADTDHTNAVAWGDIDGDGDLDLAVGNGLITSIAPFPSVEDWACVGRPQKDKVYENKHGILQELPIWTSEDEDTTSSIAWGDVDGDGDLDLAIGNCDAPNKVYLNDHGVLQNKPVWMDKQSNTTFDTFSIAWGDMNGDGYLDLAVGNYNGPNRVYLNIKGELQNTVIWTGTVGNKTRSIAWGDVDRDGDLDLAIGSQDKPNKVYLNNGKTLQQLLWIAPETDTARTRSVAWGDVNGDGYLDLAVGNLGQSDRVYLNEHGVLQPVATWNSQINDETRSVMWGDVDNDGDLDLTMANSGGASNPSVRIYQNVNGILHYAWQSQFFPAPRSIALGDTDRDGDLDIAVGSTFRTQNKLFLNKGAPISFSEAAWVLNETSNTSSIAWGDVNNDGYLDLVTGNDGTDTIYHNNNGILSIHGQQISQDTDTARSIVLGDVDGNGYLDLVAGNAVRPCGMEPIKLYLNFSGVFESTARIISPPICTRSIALGDVNGDGSLDLAVGIETEQHNQVYINDGKGNFQKADQWLPEINRTFGVAWGDVDQDSDLDLAVVTHGDGNYVYLNSNGMLSKDPAWRSPEAAMSGSPQWGDVNGDGFIDLAISTWSAANIVYPNQGQQLATTGIWLSRESDSTISVALGDADGDGDLDLAASNNWASHDKLYLNENSILQQDGLNLTKDTARSSSNMMWGDVDRDGDLDLAVSSEDQQNRVYLNDSAGNRQEPLNHVPYVAVTRPITTGDANFYSSPTILEQQSITIAYSLYDSDEDPVGQIAAFYSLDGGGKWQSAIATSNTVTTNLKTQGAALVFDGIDDYVQLPSLNYDYFQGFTVEAWVYFEQFNRWSRIIDLGNGPQSDNILFANTGVSQDLSFEVYIDGIAYGIRARNVLEPKRWYHLAATVDGLGHAVIYKDGEVVQEGVMPFPRSVERNRNFIGRSNWLPEDGHFAGQMDDVRIWNVARTQSQIKENMTQRLKVEEVGLIAYWQFNEGNGVIAIDHTPNHHDGLLGGGMVDQQPQRKNRPTAHTFVWDTFVSGLFGQSDNVVFRLEAYPNPPITGVANSYLYTNAVPGPFQYVYASATTFPFRVRGSQVQVIDEFNNPIPNAQVYRIPNGQTLNGALISNGTTPFRTNGQGYLQGRGALTLGDQLLALAPQPLPPTMSWAVSLTHLIHLYHTNGQPTPLGLTPIIQSSNSPTVTQPGVQRLQVSAQHPLLLFDLRVALEWDAGSDPERKYLNQLEADLKKASAYLYDFSNGQAALGAITVTQNAEDWGYADVVIQSTNRLRPLAVQGGIVPTTTVDPDHDHIFYDTGQVRMGATWNRYGEAGVNLGDDWPLALAHELSHYLFFLDDTYLGLDHNNLLIAVDACKGSVMGDMYDPSGINTEYVPDGSWHEACGDTLAAKTLGRSEWTTIQQRYPMLFPTNQYDDNVGPALMPFAFTTVKVLPPRTTTGAFPDPIYFLNYQDGGVSSPSARAYLMRTINGGKFIFDQGSPVGGQNRLLTRGPHLNDTLCVFDPVRHHFGCESVSPTDEQLDLKTYGGWTPKIEVRPITSTTVEIKVSGLSDLGQPLQAQLYPEYYTATIPITLDPVPGEVGVYHGAFVSTILTDPAPIGHVHIWAGNELRADSPQMIVPYTMGGNLGKGPFFRGGGPFFRGGGPFFRGGGPALRGGHAPLASSDGQMIFFSKDFDIFAEGELYVVQSAGAVPDPPTGKAIVGLAYNLIASPNVTHILTGSISFQYLGVDAQALGVTEAEEPQLKIHVWQAGKGWQAAKTVVNSRYNLASAASQGEGLYALMAGTTQPQVASITPAYLWSYQDTSFNLALHGYNLLAPVALDLHREGSPYPVTTVATTTGIVTVPAGLPAHEYTMTLLNGDTSSLTLTRTLTILERRTNVCFYDEFEAGPNQWQIEGEWGIIALPEGGHGMTDSPQGSYRSALLPETSRSTTITSHPFDLTDCPNRRLYLRHAYVLATQGESKDWGTVEISTTTQSGWRPLASFTGGGPYSEVVAAAGEEWQNAQWQFELIDLSPYTGIIQLRLRLQVDQNITDKGWVIDALEVKTPEEETLPGAAIYLPLIAKN